MRQAIVENGIVTNIAVGNAGGIEIPENSPVGIGWAYDGVNFSAPVPTAEQTKFALQALIDAIEAGQRTAIRDAVLNKPGAMAKLIAIDNQVAALKAQQAAL